MIACALFFIICWNQEILEGVVKIFRLRAMIGAYFVSIAPSIVSSEAFVVTMIVSIVPKFGAIGTK